MGKWRADFWILGYDASGSVFYKIQIPLMVGQNTMTLIWKVELFVIPKGERAITLTGASI